MNKIIIPILAIVLVSACIGGNTQPNTATGKGLEITSFTSDQSETQSGRTARLSMAVENDGGIIVRDTNSLAFLIAPGDWLFSGSNEFQNFGKDLSPADPARGVPAETDQVTWRLTSPTITSGQTRSDTFEARVYYDYETDVNGNIWLYSETESDAAKSSGATLSKSSFSSTEGPVKVDVSVSPDPAIVTSSDRLFSMNIKISNTGSGTVYKRSAVDYLRGDISFSPDDLNIVSIDVNSPFQSVSPECQGNQELIQGKDLNLICDVTVSSGQVPAAKQSFPVTVKVRYGYYKVQTLSVNVIGR